MDGWTHCLIVSLVGLVSSITSAMSFSSFLFFFFFCFVFNHCACCISPFLLWHAFVLCGEVFASLVSVLSTLSLTVFLALLPPLLERMSQFEGHISYAYVSVCVRAYVCVRVRVCEGESVFSSALFAYGRLLFFCFFFLFLFLMMVFLFDVPACLAWFAPACTLLTYAVLICAGVRVWLARPWTSTLRFN